MSCITICISKRKDMDGNTWQTVQTFQTGFNQVQDILDQNRVLIQEINLNHVSKVPECLTRNVLLIKALNNNITKVVDLYASLSCNLADGAALGDEILQVDANVTNISIPGNQKRLRESDV